MSSKGKRSGTAKDGRKWRIYENHRLHYTAVKSKKARLLHLENLVLQKLDTLMRQQ